MTRDEFMSKLIFEEKTWEIASNMDMINRFHFCKVVTKNLLYLIHARRHFGLHIDLSQNFSIIEGVNKIIDVFVTNEREQQTLQRCDAK